MSKKRIDGSRPVDPALRVGVLVDLPWTPSAGGHVKTWERIAAAAVALGPSLDLTVHFSGAEEATHVIAPHVRYRIHRPVLSTARLPFLSHVPDHSDLAPYHPRLAAALARLRRHSHHRRRLRVRAHRGAGGAAARHSAGELDPHHRALLRARLHRGDHRALRRRRPPRAPAHRWIGPRRPRRGAHAAPARRSPARMRARAGVERRGSAAARRPARARARRPPAPRHRPRPLRSAQARPPVARARDGHSVATAP